nr:MAG TPA: hypothetical protein [Caudoviricetes sp.]
MNFSLLGYGLKIDCCLFFGKPTPRLVLTN